MYRLRHRRRVRRLVSAVKREWRWLVRDVRDLHDEIHFLREQRRRWRALTVTALAALEPPLAPDFEIHPRPDTDGHR